MNAGPNPEAKSRVLKACEPHPLILLTRSNTELVGLGRRGGEVRGGRGRWVGRGDERGKGERR